MARAPLYLIVATGRDPAPAIGETLDFGAHLP
jgi:hypothetical protein